MSFQTVSHRKKNATVVTEKDQHKMRDLLDWVIGSWVDQRSSTYHVWRDGDAETCSVTTIRANGETINTRALIKINRGKVIWGHYYKLDCTKATKQEILWIDQRGGKNFHWTRIKKQEETSKKIPVLHPIEKQPVPTPPSSTKASEADPGEDEHDMDNESDDDDIVAEAWTKERRPIPVEEIRWSQDTIGIRFRDGQYLVDMLKDLVQGRMKPEQVPAMHVILYEDQLFAITGNRRLWVLKNYARMANKEVKVYAEVHPPKAMQAKWAKRRYTSKSSGETVRFVHKSFADKTFANMKDALQMAEGSEGVRVKWLQTMESQSAGKGKGKGATWQVRQVSEPIQQEEEEEPREPQEEEPQEEEKEDHKVPASKNTEDQELLRLLSPTYSPRSDVPELSTQELREMAGTQLYFVAGLLFQAADANEQIQTQCELRELGYRMQEAAEVAEDVDAVRGAVQAMRQMLEELRWIECPPDLGIQVLQATQMLEMSVGIDGSDNAGSGSFQSSSFQPTVVFLPPTIHAGLPSPPWLWRWQMAGQMAAMRSMYRFQ